VEGCGLHKKEKWRGLCTSLPFFFLETEQEGGTVGWGVARPWVSVFNRLPTEGYAQGGKFWVRRRRDQELEGARNTKLRQVRAARSITSYVLYGLYCL
jgi:hypothetical protein